MLGRVFDGQAAFYDDGTSCYNMTTVVVMAEFFFRLLRIQLGRLQYRVLATPKYRGGVRSPRAYTHQLPARRGQGAQVVCVL